MNPLRTAPPTGSEPAVPPVAAGHDAVASATRCAGTVAVVLLATGRSAIGAWGLSRLVLGRLPLRHVPGLGFAKVLGCGRGGGFGLTPGLQHHGLFLVFDREASALRFTSTSPVMAAYRRHTDALGIAVLRATSSRGAWSGRTIAVTASAPARGPVAALTRASIRWPHAAAFWRHAPAAEAGLASAAGCRLAAGLGEAPLLRQATFSLWDDVAALEGYARGGAHRLASRAATGGGYFSESMFVRFVPLALAGHWQGCDLGRL